MCITGRSLMPCRLRTIRFTVPTNLSDWRAYMRVLICGCPDVHPKTLRTVATRLVSQHHARSPPSPGKFPIRPPETNPTLLRPNNTSRRPYLSISIVLFFPPPFILPILPSRNQFGHDSSSTKHQHERRLKWREWPPRPLLVALRQRPNRAIPSLSCLVLCNRRPPCPQV